MGRRRKKDNGYLRDGFVQSKLPHDNRSVHTKSKGFGQIKKKLLLRRKKRRDWYSSRSSRARKSLFRTAATGGFLIVAAALFLVAARPHIEKQLEEIAFFQVDEIAFFGTRLVSREVIRQTAGIIPHQTSLFGFDEDAVEERLQKLDWIASVSVEKDWPSTIEISIKENQPVALLHSAHSVDGQLRYIDHKGKPFMTVSPGADIDFPVITGLTDIADSSLRKKALDEVLTLLTGVQRRKSAFLPAQLVSEIHVKADGEMVVYLVEYPFPIFLEMVTLSRKSGIWSMC